MVDIRSKKGLPTGWIKTELGDLCEVVRGGSPRPMGSPKYFNGDIPFIKISDVTKADFFPKGH
jgi:type I restriction enzyme S subunit